MQQGSTDNADRLLAERRAGSSAVGYADVYEERAARKEAEQRELEAYRAEQKAEVERRTREEMGARWEAEEGHTVDLNSSLTDQLTAARDSRDEFMRRTGGEELAARITAGTFHPWTR
ncbi:hypothetical protein [Streptomyces sp. NPDC048392]|uniref:hypothetical protein n=1 Tax=Streptomyces sp. NPDC048392 TaxID=3365543 RepID=UPI00371F1239